jgi:hypothetical protein
MIAGAAALVLALGMSASQQSDDPSARAGGPRVEAARIGVQGLVSDAVPAVDEDTVRVRRRAVRLSDAYHTRLKIHKYASYAMLPMFAFEYAAGDQLMKKSASAPSWAKDYHGLVAGGLAALFTINTATGALNWWETRHQESGRTWRTAHAALMLLADAGFTVTGQLADQAENSIDKRRLHKTMALTSISIATVSYVMMLKPFRRD